MVRKSPAGGQRQRGLVLLSGTSTFTDCNNRPLLPSSSASPFHSTPPVSVKGQRRGGSSPPPAKPTAPTPQQAPTLNPSARKLNQRGASEGSRPLKTLHCLRKASPHRERSICNTVRGVAHYRPSPVPLCLFCAADRRIQLPSWANKVSAVKKKLEKV